MPGKKANYQSPMSEGLVPSPPPPLPANAPAEAVGWPVEVEYPSEDGQPLAENDKQARAMVNLFSPLQEHYDQADNVYVGLDLLIYYEQDNNKRRVAPDVFVARGVPNHSRDTYKIWEEGKPPDFVLEVASPSTARYDAEGKKDLYAELGVREYWLYDPKGDLHKPRLKGYQLIGSKYRRLRDRKRAGGALAVGSRVLNLELRFEAGRLRLWNPAARQYLLTLKEANAALRAAEARTQAEFEACRALEERLAELEADLRAARKPHEPSD